MKQKIYTVVIVLFFIIAFMLYSDLRLRKESEVLRQKSQELALRLLETKDSHAQQIKAFAGQLRIIETIGNHPQNSHKYFYSVTTTSSSSSAKILKIGEDGWHNFVNKFAIHPRVGQAKHKIIIKNQKSNSMIAYIWEKGQFKKISPYTFKDGDIIEVVVDFVSGKFEWLKNGAKITQCSIPESMKQEPIYLSILINSKSDEVQLLA